MAIIFPIDLPLSEVTEIDIDDNNQNTFLASPYTGRGRVQEFEGDFWSATIRFRSLSRPLGQPVLGFARSLRKSVGTFVVPFPGYDVPLGLAKDNPASPSVDGSGQAGNLEVVIKSGPASITGWLLAGDIIQIGPATRPHWHTVLQDVDTDGAGGATIDIWPRVREGTIDGDLVSFNCPLCLFRLTDDISTALRRPTRHSLDLVCREAI